MEGKEICGVGWVVTMDVRKIVGTKFQRSLFKRDLPENRPFKNVLSMLSYFCSSRNCR